MLLTDARRSGQAQKAGGGRRMPCREQRSVSLYDGHDLVLGQHARYAFQPPVNLLAEAVDSADGVADHGCPRFDERAVRAFVAEGVQQAQCFSDAMMGRFRLALPATQ
jgi:hypothetical protein